MQLYSEGKLEMNDYMAFMLEPLKGKTSQELETLANEFVAAVLPSRIYQQGLTLIQELKKSNHRVVLISATADFIVEAVARFIGVEEVLAIQLAYDEKGHHTGMTKGILTFREGKVRRLEQWLKQQQESIKDAQFYSDSINDLALLNHVKKPFATNPDPQLRAIAAERHWPILDWKL